ncbi:MAG: protease complex subunit PrcB family protein [Clostridiales bacterium]|nr:protease complex subunit PrcB family protein [Clostridiales bacterium]
MNYDAKKTLCLGTAAAAVLFMLAGCMATHVKADSDKPQSDKVTTITVPLTTQPESRPDPTTGPSETEREEKEETSAPGKFPESGTINDLEYKVTAASPAKSSRERGYYVYAPEKTELPYAILISAGEFNTGGHDISISGIQYDGNTLTITVSETSPASGDAVIQAITYPCCAVRFSKLPKSIKVVSDKGQEFKCLYYYNEASEIEPGYFAVLENGSGEIIQKTYVYKTPDGKYRYDHATATTTSWGSTHWNEVLKGSGFADTREEVVEAAKKFGSCGFVLYPGDNQARSISEFLAGKE